MNYAIVSKSGINTPNEKESLIEQKVFVTYAKEKKDIQITSAAHITCNLGMTIIQITDIETHNGCRGT